MTEPASIRYKNPGAMWGGNAISKKWGEVGNVALNDGLGQNNHIAVFPTYVAGICAQIDLWRSARYKNKRFSDAIRIWSGGNYVQSYIDFVTKRVPGMTADTIMSDAMLSSPMGIAFLRAQAWHEAGKVYPAPDADWLEAQRLVFRGGTAPKPVTPKKTIATAVVVSTASTAAVTAHAGWSWTQIGLTAFIVGAIVTTIILIVKRARS